jgi:hypothetical protein
MRNLLGDPVHLWLSESNAGADRLVPLRRGLHLRRDVHLQQLSAREGARSGDPVIHAGTGVRADVG